MDASDATLETAHPSAGAGRPPRPESFEPAAMARARRYVPVPLDALVDNGEPVDVPPPLIEPIMIGFDEPVPRPPEEPPLLGSARRETPPPRSALELLRGMRKWVPQLAAVSAEPVGERGGPVDETWLERARQQVVAWLAALAQQWRDAAAALNLGDWRRFTYWGRWVAVAAVIIAISYAAGFGLFSSPAHRSVAPLANAPSDPAQRLAYFQHGAQAGNPEAELQLAILYAKGEGVAQDYSIAARWFRAAAEQGLARAQYDLGVLYERGRGVLADPVQAGYWYRKAAEGKYPLAQYNLAVAYTKGEGTRKDPTEAAVWYRRAAAQGVVQAMVNLGMLYERGEGVPVSPVDAYAWYLAAGRRGNQPAAKRADDLFGALSQPEQVRAQMLASAVAGSINDPVPGISGG
jgi:TPR repeat protein